MKTNKTNCYIFNSKLSQSKRKSIKDSCIYKDEKEIFITYNENDTFEKFELDFYKINKNSEYFFNIKKKSFGFLVSFISIFAILFTILSISIYEDFFKKILFESPFLWQRSDWISVFCIGITIIGIFMMPSVMGGESNEFKNLLYSWFNKDVKKLKRFKHSVENFDKDCTLNLYNFDLASKEHWIWKILIDVLVANFDNINFFVRNENIKNISTYLKKLDNTNIKIIKEKKEKNKINTQVIFSSKEKKLNNLLQLCSTKITNKNYQEDFISLELFEFCSNALIKEEKQDEEQVLFASQNFINRAFYDFNLLKQEKSLQIYFLHNYEFQNLEEDKKRLSFYLQNKVEYCIKHFENAISLVILYYYVKNSILNEKRLMNILEKLIYIISLKQQYEFIEMFWFDIAGEMFDCDKIELFEENKNSIYRKLDIQSLEILANLFKRNGFFQQAILINKYLMVLNPIKYSLDICLLYERMGNFEYALASLPKKIDEKLGQKPSNTQIKYLQRKSWIIVSQRNEELKQEGQESLEEMKNLLFNHSENNEAIWLWYYYNIKANYEEWNNNFDEAINNYKKCLSIPLLGAFEYGASFVNMAIAYRFKFIENNFDNISFINDSIQFGNIGMNLKKSVGDRDEMPIVIHNQVLNILYKLLIDFDSSLCQEVYNLSKQAINISDSTGSKKRLAMLLIENYISSHLLQIDETDSLNRLEEHIKTIDKNELNQVKSLYTYFLKNKKINKIEFLDEKI